MSVVYISSTNEKEQQKKTTKFTKEMFDSEYGDRMSLGINDDDDADALDETCPNSVSSELMRNSEL